MSEFIVKVASYPNREIRTTFLKVRERDCSPKGVARNQPESCPAQPLPLALDISSKLENLPEAAPRRPSEFGLNAKRTLLRIGGALMEHDAVPQHGLFFTATLPGSTPEAMAAIADEASWIIHRVKAWVSSYVESKLDFYVWERQKRGALHLHYYLYCPAPEIRSFLMSRWHSEWCSLLKAVGLKRGVDMWRKGFGDGRSTSIEKTQAYCQEVRKSVSAYLSKYCSKDAGKSPGYGSKYRPKRWWGCSRPLLALMREMSSEVVISFSHINRACSYVKNLGETLAPLALHQYDYRHKVGVGCSSVAYFTEGLWTVARNVLRRALPMNGSAKYSEGEAPRSLARPYQAVAANMYQLWTSTTRYRRLIPSSSVDSLTWIKSLSPQQVCLHLRKIHSEIIELSSVLSCQKLSRFLPPLQMEMHRLAIASIWRIQESAYRWGDISSEKCEELLQFFIPYTQKMQGSTTPVLVHGLPLTPGESEPSSLAWGSQTELRLDG